MLVIFRVLFPNSSAFEIVEEVVQKAFVFDVVFSKENLNNVHELNAEEKD